MIAYCRHCKREIRYGPDGWVHITPSSHDPEPLNGE